MQEDRGMKKWRAFATLPEQYIGLQKIINKQSEVPKPHLTEEQMEQLNQVLVEALHTNKAVYITYYMQGKHITKVGFVQLIDSSRDSLVFMNEGGDFKNKARLSDLIDVYFI